MPSGRSYGSGLRRDADLLDVLADAPPDGLGVTAVAERAGRDKAQVSRALAALAQAGLVDRDADTLTYRVGSRLWAIASRSVETQLERVAAPFLREVVDGLHETTHLCVLRSGAVLTVRSELPAHAFRGRGWEGTSVDARATSAGHALLSDLDAAELAAWWERHPAPAPVVAGPSVLPARPGARPVTLARLTEQVAAVRSRGFAAVDEEFEPGLVGVSAPVRDFRGRVVAALNVAAPKPRLGEHLEVAGAFTARVATRLSAALGAG